MKTFKYALVLALVGITLSTTACNGLPWAPVVVNQGPAVVRMATGVAVHAAFEHESVKPEEAVEVKKHLADAKLLVTQGAAPATALDALAAFLNEKLPNPTVRQAIQYGVTLVKTNVVLPVDGVLPEEAKVWVLAVLDGGIDGCDAYLAAQPLVGAPAVKADVPSQISFR